MCCVHASHGRDAVCRRGAAVCCVLCACSLGPCCCELARGVLLCVMCCVHASYGRAAVCRRGAAVCCVLYACNLGPCC